MQRQSIWPNRKNRQRSMATKKGLMSVNIEQDDKKKK